MGPHLTIATLASCSVLHRLQISVPVHARALRTAHVMHPLCHGFDESPTPETFRQHWERFQVAELQVVTGNADVFDGLQPSLDFEKA